MGFMTKEQILSYKPKDFPEVNDRITRYINMPQEDRNKYKLDKEADADILKFLDDIRQAYMITKDILESFIREHKKGHPEQSLLMAQIVSFRKKAEQLNNLCCW